MTEGAIRIVFLLVGAALPWVLICFFKGLMLWLDEVEERKRREQAQP